MGRCVEAEVFSVPVVTVLAEWWDRGGMWLLRAGYGLRGQRIRGVLPSKLLT